MADTIKMRRDTAANWASVNPILAAGEWGLETDTGIVKIGDGTTAYDSLASPSLLGPLDISTPSSYGSIQTPNVTNGGAGMSSSGDYNVGYKFTVNANGQITALAARVNDTSSHTVRLYNSSGTVIASAVIVGVAGAWVTTAITPVAVTAGSWYVVAVRSTTFYQTTYGVIPLTTGNITINEGRYIGSSNAIPNNVQASLIYNADVVYQKQIGGTAISVDAAAEVLIKALSLTDCPTSSAGLASGRVWSDSGTLKIV